MEKELTFELYEIKDALNLDDSSYIKLRTELRKKGVLAPPQVGRRAVFGKEAIPAIKDYLDSKDKRLGEKFIVWFLTKRKKWVKSQEEIKNLKVDSSQVVFRQVMEQLGVDKETREYRSLLEKLKGEGIAKVYGIIGKQITYINPTERFFEIVSQYLNVSPKKVAEAVERIENSNEVELLDYMTRIGAMPYYKHVYNYLRGRNAVIKGKYVKIKKEAIAYIKEYLTKKKSPATERITEAIPQTSATSQEGTRPKASHSELTQMERLVDIAFRKEKIIIRKILLSEARQHNPISLLSFPGMTWFFERDLIALAGENISQIVGLERDKRVYEFMVLNKPPEKSYIHTFNTTDHEFAKNPPNYIKPFNFVWLDYMGAFSWKKLETFEDLLKNRLFCLPATLALTFQAGLEYSDVLDYYKKVTRMKPAAKGRKPDWKMIRLTALPMIYAQTASKYGVSCYKVIEREYVEPVKMCHHAPMVLLVLRLENKY
ncbi:hypothetical protein HS1_000938 [Candidatus Desulfofervidus auxilii]|uniref:Uncharacterized protein n=1 Tax=Desulfofervidus auxilii TaxID=1621989 RepID=A0A7U4QJZ1_DESA2|nr:hypothetical protein [Candidatus Desulfofervidus auxilii]AMM40742.1 hypothetical protein HS1_000938 [Candidatus Desulfofervidus auxilii]